MLELTETKDAVLISGRQLYLQSVYQSVYGTLWGMHYGGGLRPEVATALGATSPQLDQTRWLSEMICRQKALNEFLPQNLPDEDWLTRQRRENARELEQLPETELFVRLVNACGTRTVRRIANQSRWIGGNTLLWRVLWERPEYFLRCKANSRFPRSPDKQIDFLARGIGGLIAGYKPNTALKYLAALVTFCQHCGTKPAVIELRHSGTRLDSIEGVPFPSRSKDRTHTSEQCRYSSVPCPAHHPCSPISSGTPWCGTC